MKRTFVVVLILTTWSILSGNAQNPRSVWQEFLAREGRDWRATFQDSGRLRTLYGKSNRSFDLKSENPSNLIRDYDSLFGINGEDLRLERSKIHESGNEYIFQQYLSGFPVEGAEVHLNFDRDFRLIAASSTVQPGLWIQSAPIIQASTAQKRAIRFFKGNATVSKSSLLFIPSGKYARLVWRIEVVPESLTQGSRIFYVDASDPRIVLRMHKTFANVDGQATVFLENPVVTPTTMIAPIKNLDDSTLLAGKFERTYNANFENWVRGFRVDLSVFTTATEAGRQYNYASTDSRFTEAMAYFHINRVHDQWQSFGFNGLNSQYPVFVNVISLTTGKGFDNALYSRRDPQQFKNGLIIMGAGNKLENLGHDADVYYHEYGHAVLDRIKPQFFESIETNYARAFHEGFSDVSASAITGNSKVGEFGLRFKANKRFIGRNLDNNNQYPKNVILPGYGKSESHHTGLIFGGAWWDLQKEIGSNQAQKILYDSLRMLPRELTFFDVRDAMLTADRNKNGGANETKITQAFAKHGLSGPEPGQHGSVSISALKTFKINITNGNLTPKTKFKRDETIDVLANYTGTGLTLGYNLITEHLSITGPPGGMVDSFAWYDEVSNGTHTGKEGALQVELYTYPDTKTGTYTVTIQSRLGGTLTVTETRSVSFQVTN